MLSRKDVIDFCLSLADDVYGDYPFRDPNLTEMWRGTYKSVVPAYHTNKHHWNLIILDGTVPIEDIKTMIYDSYKLTMQKGEKSHEKVYNHRCKKVILRGSG